jgi:hypothetical protein
MNVELRGMLRAWNQHWANYEYMGASSHVRAGWIYHEEADLVSGRDSRVARLSRNGSTDVLQEFSWLDCEVLTFLDADRFPRHITHPSLHGPASNTSAPGQAMPPNPVNVTMEPVNESRPTPVSALIAQVERMSTSS